MDVEECDNYIRSVTVLKGDCSSYNCTVLVCGTNAMIPRCGKCNFTGSVGKPQLECSFQQNIPEQDLPYTGETYSSCQTLNLDASAVFQYKKNDNASFFHQGRFNWPSFFLAYKQDMSTYEICPNFLQKAKLE
nr:uncharacterized protein LOC129261221 [Lytechinus pictus]